MHKHDSGRYTGNRYKDINIVEVPLVYRQIKINLKNNI